ncbi:hypothetical protein [Candidatus Chromulinivorax destructor]|uniref:Uncharacterized protein n=1 Tax=Candidatus Chromulinivorax destructor TaxID=2066483 RepID=A0A345ZCM7_9BACT|nr:hypothetical protein [Candidatus Chromulinivorax destructor]AXK61044.1 hypothetical protein C0J27_04915 [Candidatus Chromulinivorax destructor]
MAIKMNAKSKTLLTVLLVGSLCSLRASDLVEQEPKRLQITAATEQILDAIADVSTSGQTSAIQGTGFNTSTDSLVNISNNTTNVPLATNAQAVDILQGSTAAGTAIVGGTTFTADTNDLTSVSRGLSAMEGAGFTSALASQYVNARNIALGQVIAAEGNSVLVDIYTAGTGNGTFTALNTNLAAISTAITAAMTTPSNGTISPILTAINTAQTAMFTAAGAPHSAEAVNAGLQSLEFAVNNWLAFYP